MQVENILQSKGMTVLTVTTHAPISDAVHILNKHRIGAVVVLADNGTVAGILSERDIVRHLADDPARLLSRAVREIMTTTVITCGRDTSISQLMEQMTQHRIRHIPIVDGSRLPIGVVTAKDVFRHISEQLD